MSITVASADAAADGAGGVDRDGATVRSGVRVTSRVGSRVGSEVGFFASGVLVVSLDGVAVLDALGFSGVLGFSAVFDGFGEAGFEGVPDGVALRLGVMDGLAVGLVLAVPCACSLEGTSLRISVCRSEPAPTVYVSSPPGRMPVVTATAPNAMAAEAPSSPVRTGRPARFFRWRPICCAFLVRDVERQWTHPNE
ncbi:hypothetical protein [Streptomyces xantholiticus]|uniref:hypothetical protein n=1 Tax=Streptomyces xantholiticus TaxID=68285 RepID=UPI0019856E57|nr:hypothetical protein [Streptomyces xantholiticus]GGW57877.1 hypothetical protein GCM10010381_48990 [Streptomyces xantholiticus]